MLTWMAGNLAPGTKVIADSNALLPELMARTQESYPFTLLRVPVRGDGANEQLPPEADYAVISGPEGSDSSPTNTDGGGDNRFAELGALIWERPSDKVPMIHPGLRIYRIARAAQRSFSRGGLNHYATE
jgi:hypothetical protein